jgi:hypothetical protein
VATTQAKALVFKGTQIPGSESVHV